MADARQPGRELLAVRVRLRQRRRRGISMTPDDRDLAVRDRDPPAPGVQHLLAVCLQDSLKQRHPPARPDRAGAYGELRDGHRAEDVDGDPAKPLTLGWLMAF